MSRNFIDEGNKFWFDLAYKKASRVLERSKILIPEKEWEQQIFASDKKDKFHNGYLKNKENYSKYKLSIISEGLICYLVNQGILFGNHARAYKTTDYDDFIHGVDILLKFENSTETIYAALDVTYSYDLNKKFTRITSELLNNRMAKVNYGMESSRLEKYQIPKFVLGMSSSNLRELAQRWVNNPSELYKNELIKMLVAETHTQLHHYINFAQRNNISDCEDTLSKLKRFICNSTKNAKEILSNSVNFNDIVFKAIEKELRNINAPSRLII